MRRMRHGFWHRRLRTRSGQFIIIYIMGIFTIVVAAFATLAVGQVVVRKQWAQMVADAGAYAGAARQAQGMNSIARITNWEFYLLRALQLRDRQVGWYEDSWTDCWAAYFTADVDDVKDKHDTYIKPAFQGANAILDGYNYGYRYISAGDAIKVAKQDFQNFFGDEYANNPSGFECSGCSGTAARAALYGTPPLVALTPYFSDTVAWFYWTADSGPCPWGVCLGYVCDGLSYLNCDITGVAGKIGYGGHSDQPDPPESSWTYENMFRVMTKDNDTNFLFYVKIPAVRPMFGMMKPLGMIPPILAIARAKPYHGNIGFGDPGGSDENDENDRWPKRKPFYYNFSDLPTSASPPAYTWNVQWKMKHAEHEDYRAKLVPVLPIRADLHDAPVIADFAMQMKNNRRGATEALRDFLGVTH